MKYCKNPRKYRMSSKEFVFLLFFIFISVAIGVGVQNRYFS